MFRQHVDAEFFAGFRKTPLTVEREDVGEDAAAFVPVDEFEEFQCHFFRGNGEGAIDGGAVVVVNAGVLVVKGAIENAAAQGFGVEHAGNEGFEFDVAVVE